MIMQTGYNSKRKDTYAVYLQTYPLKIYNNDFMYILVNCLDDALKDGDKLEWTKVRGADNIYESFNLGGQIWVNGKEITKELIVDNLALALMTPSIKRELVYKNELRDITTARDMWKIIMQIVVTN